MLANYDIDYTLNEMPQELIDRFKPIGILGEKPTELKKLNRPPETYMNNVFLKMNDMNFL